MAVTLLSDPNQPTASRAAGGLLQVAGSRLSASHLKLRQACWAYYPDFLDALPGPVLLRRDGHLRLGGSVTARQGYLSTLKGLGVRGEVWSQDRLDRDTGGAVTAEGAVWLADAALDPEHLLDVLDTALQTGNVRRVSAQVTRVEAHRVGDREGQVWSADLVVLACGAGLSNLSPDQDWGYREEPGWGAVFAGRLPFGCSLEGAGQTLVPTDTGWRLAGSQDWSDPPPLRSLVAWEGEETARRSGSRCTAPDGLPVAGRRADGVYLLGGLGRNGLLTAPLLARGLAATMLGAEPADWLLPFAPGRPGIGEHKKWARRIGPISNHS